MIEAPRCGPKRERMADFRSRVGQIQSSSYDDRRAGPRHELIARHAGQLKIEFVPGFRGGEVTIVPRESMPIQSVNRFAQRRHPDGVTDFLE